jgi:hypothetical protein
VDAAKRIAMLSAPVALIVFSFLHGRVSWAETQHLHTASNEEWIQHLSDIKEQWLAIHIAGVFLFPLLGLTVWWMLPLRGIASRISQAALVVYVPLYIAVDAVLGIGSAILIHYRDRLPITERAAADQALAALFFEPSAIDWLDQGASLAWRIALFAAAIAVWRTNGWRLSLPLVVAGWTLSKSHFPPLGEVAGLALLVAVWVHLFLTPEPQSIPAPPSALRRSTPPSSTPSAPTTITSAEP